MYLRLLPKNVVLVGATEIQIANLWEDCIFSILHLYTPTLSSMTRRVTGISQVFSGDGHLVTVVKSRAHYRQHALKMSLFSGVTSGKTYFLQRQIMVCLKNYFKKKTCSFLGCIRIFFLLWDISFCNGTYICDRYLSSSVGRIVKQSFSFVGYVFYQVWYVFRLFNFFSLLFGGLSDRLFIFWSHESKLIRFCQKSLLLRRTGVCFCVPQKGPDFTQCASFGLLLSFDL